MNTRREVGKKSGFFHKFLRLFTEVYPGEGVTALLLTLNIFLILAAYYIIKIVRDSSILTEWGPETRSYLFGVISVLLIFVVKAFSYISSKVPRQKLIAWITLFFISNLILFSFLNLFGIPFSTISIMFYIWTSIFNVVIIAQFWGFANDIYTESAGKRLFPIIAFGATFGAFIGSYAFKPLDKWMGLYQLLLVSAAVLGLCILLTFVIHKREIKGKEEAGPQKPLKPKPVEKEKPLKKGGGFNLVFKKRYLLYIALFVMLLNLINTNGGYILDRVIVSRAEASYQTEAAEGQTLDEYMEAFTSRFFSDFYIIMNLMAMFVQLFLVSRIFKWFGVRTAVFILPFIALGGYFFISLGASLLLVKWIKAAENGTDYSLMNTTRHALFLITSREEKYKAKAATDTFFHRAGDVMHSLIIFLWAQFILVESFAKFNIVMAVVWILLGVLIVREHKRLS
jgi:ATP:ADP antiporter, AAA family